jgi:enoyl-CoA hydratase
MGAWTRRQEGPVAILTLLRPPINALDQSALDELAEILGGIDGDAEIRVLVIMGGLDGIFCSGGDLRYWRDIRDPDAVSRSGREAFARIERLPIPTIAAINGHAIGDGLALALACDFRIASEKAMFRVPEVMYGFIPGWGLIHRLVDLVGRATASELLLSGRRVDATRSLEVGLVTQVVPAEHILEEVLVRAQEMAAFSPAALRAAKCALSGADEVKCFEAVWGETDWREGIDALLAKRTPVFGPIDMEGEEDDLSGRVQTDRVASRRSACC